MESLPNEWTLLVYKIPTQPSRLRLQIWRRLQAMGAVYLQNAVCLLPARADLDENMHYVAAGIEEMGGSCQLFSARTLLPGGADQIEAEFRALADERLDALADRLTKLSDALDSAVGPAALERVEEELKRERVAYLRARRLNYFGSTKEPEVDALLERLRRTLDDLYRSNK